MKFELREAWRLCGERKAGDEGRLPILWIEPDEEMRDLNRRSNGRKEGVGELRPGREAREGSTLLPGEDINEP
jgi:hypothetical protein